MIATSHRISGAQACVLRPTRQKSWRARTMMSWVYGHLPRGQSVRLMKGST